PQDLNREPAVWRIRPRGVPRSWPRSSARTPESRQRRRQLALPSREPSVEWLSYLGLVCRAAERPQDTRPPPGELTHLKSHAVVTLPADLEREAAGPCHGNPKR